jgi:plasmid maintenance system antidote protein VapI
VLRELRPFILKPDEELVDITKTDFYKKTKAAMTPGDYLRELREANGLTLHEVGERLSVSAQYVHDMQSGTRGVSKDTAKRLGELFGVSPAVFI